MKNPPSKRKIKTFLISVIYLTLVTIISSLILQNIQYKSYIKKFKENKFNGGLIEDDSNLKEKENHRLLENAIENFLLESANKTLNVDDFIELRKKEELHTALWHALIGKYENLHGNDDELTLYKNKLINATSFLTSKEIEHLTGYEKLMATLHQSLYPWLYGYRYHSIGDLVNSFNGKGIVICTGNFHFKYARSTIDSLRNIINCKLPIEVFYNGEDDLSAENREILKSYDNVFVEDISTYFNGEIIEIERWAIKPFSVLASRFEEVILMDADVVYLRDPEELFEEKGYTEMGTLFLKDRTLYPGWHKELSWLKSWMVNPLPETEKSRYYNAETIHEMESSTVLIHKTKTLIGLLAVCKLNEGAIRKDIVYENVYGDKETFWMGYDMAREHYYMYPELCAFVGELSDTQICGHVGHVINDRLYFWNGHIVQDKNMEELNLIKFESYYIENKNISWNKEHNCLIYNIDVQMPIYFSFEEIDTFKKIMDKEKEAHFILP